MSKKPVIVFEGIEGSGKSHHINTISKYLKKNNIQISKMDDRYLKSVRYFISENLNNNFWNSNNKISETLNNELKLNYSKRLSPYQIAQKLLD